MSKIEVTVKSDYSAKIKKRPAIKIMGRFDIFPIFIATFASRRVTLIATHSKSQKQTRLPIRYLYFILPFKPLINKEVIKVFQNYEKIHSWV